MAEAVAQLSITKLASTVAAGDWNGAVALAKEIAIELPDDSATEHWVVEQFEGGWGRQGEEKVRGLFTQARAVAARPALEANKGKPLSTPLAPSSMATALENLLNEKDIPARLAAAEANLTEEEKAYGESDEEEVPGFADQGDEEVFEANLPATLPIPTGLTGEIILPIAAGALEQVHTLNQKHAVIGNYGSKCAVLSWERWNVDQRVMVPTFQSFVDFKNRYMNRYVERETDTGLTRVPAGRFWLSHPSRLNYDGVVFEPGEGEVLPGNRLNLWRGFALTPRRGSWKRLRNHIYCVLGGGDWQAGRYIMRWMAWTLQNPGKPAEAVLVFQGGEGAGKGTLARVMLKIFGAYAMPVSDPKHLTGSFSGHLHHCVFMFLDEAFWAGNVAAEGRLKSLVTEETIMIEPKYFGPFQVRNVLHIMMSSNNDWVVPAGHGSRRYAVYKVSNARVGDFGYFDHLNAELEGGGIEAMLHDLLRLDLGGWHPKHIYETAALVEQKQHSLRGLDAWIEAMLQEGVLPVPSSAQYPNRCLSKNLLGAAKEFDRFTNESRVAKKLQDLLLVSQFNNKYARGWVFPSLAECRRLWEMRNGGRWHWRRDVSEWQCL